MKDDITKADGHQDKSDQNTVSKASEVSSGYADFEPIDEGPAELPACEFQLPPPAIEEKDHSTGDNLSETDPRAQRDQLVALAQSAGIILFADNDNHPYAKVPVDGHWESWSLGSNDFKRWLRRLWLDKSGCGIGSSVIKDAIDTLDAKAFDADRFETHIRIAHHDGNIYVDLCNDQWQVVKITSLGWDVVDECPVKFLRKPGMLPLPMPIHGGNIDALRPLINAPTHDIWRLVVAFILGAFSQGPYPVLILQGEQGSSKSFLSRTLRQIIDPSELAVTTAPREPRDVIIAATNSHVVALDNLSRIPDWLSDLLCCILTGAAYRERKYHSNTGDEVLFKARNPILVNGIDFAMKGDLVDRAILLTLPVIDASNRRDEGELNQLLQKEMPGIIGGIFDVLVGSLKELPNTQLIEKPRMADFALWVTAAEVALGWEPGSFMSAYNENRKDGYEQALESEPFAVAIRDKFIKDKKLTGTAAELPAILSGADKVPRGWPDSPKGVASTLARIAPMLRRAGIDFDRVRKKGKRVYRFYAVEHD